MHVKSLALKESLPVSLKDVLKIGLFVFLLSISSRIRLYLPYSPVPITFQTLVVFLSVVFLGRKALPAQLVYIGLGAAGIGVFSSGAGLFYLAGPTGGYIIGFLLASFLLIKIIPLAKNTLWYIACFLIADSVILISGSLWIKIIMNVSLARAVNIGILPFIYGDALKIALAALITSLAKPAK
ncbi:MAG: biotin transporter BioY [Candidatus Omnitrophica bacterium]|nr:biotin transporter BioY [Candidatus Omnitrophota bacterium]